MKFENIAYEIYAYFAIFEIPYNTYKKSTYPHKKIYKEIIHRILALPTEAFLGLHTSLIASFSLSNK